MKHPADDRAGIEVRGQGDRVRRARSRVQPADRVVAEIDVAWAGHVSQRLERLPADDPAAEHRDDESGEHIRPQSHSRSSACSAWISCSGTTTAAT